MNHRLTVPVVLALVTPLSLLGQGAASGKEGPRTVLPVEREIALARSAAPAAVSAEATVLIWSGDEYRIGVEGSNGVTCFVSRSWVESLEPHCFDPEAARTILPMHRLSLEMRHAGASQEEIDRATADGISSGRFRLPTRPAMSYMMSSSQVLYNDEGNLVGNWRPHLMIFYPYLTADELGLFGAPSTDAAIVVDPGTPLSNIMIVVEEFVDPVPAGGDG